MSSLSDILKTLDGGFIDKYKSPDAWNGLLNNY